MSVLLKKDYKKYFIYFIILLILIAVIIYIFKSVFKEEKVILFISSNIFGDIGNFSVLQPYLLDNVIPIIYDYDKVNSFNDLIILLKNTMKQYNVKKVNHVGIMFDLKQKYKLSLFKKDYNREVKGGHEHLYDNIDEYYDFLIFCEYLTFISGTTNIDLIVSAIIQERHKNIFDFFDRPDFKINLSLGNTGGSHGDWYLDQGNVNLIGVYFKETINKSNLSLHSFRTLQNNTKKSTYPTGQQQINQNGINMDTDTDTDDIQNLKYSTYPSTE